MRIHSLPESKRYADTPSEYSLLLSRHNEAATEALGSQSQCILFAGQYVGNPETKLHFPSNSGFENMDFKPFKTIERYEPQIDPAFGPDFINIWYAPVSWSSEQFDEIIKAVADDKVRHILFASLETGEAYAPYDGGADLFLNSVARRDELKQRYKQWLSTHPKGL